MTLTNSVYLVISNIYTSAQTKNASSPNLLVPLSTKGRYLQKINQIEGNVPKRDKSCFPYKLNGWQVLVCQILFLNEFSFETCSLTFHFQVIITFMLFRFIRIHMSRLLPNFIKKLMAHVKRKLILVLVTCCRLHKLKINH